jgi:hypothetical protein
VTPTAPINLEQIYSQADEPCRGAILREHSIRPSAPVPRAALATRSQVEEFLVRRQNFDFHPWVIPPHVRRIIAARKAARQAHSA